jgi:single-strand DNA-binding protein
MLQTTIVGHIGQDAEVKITNGKKSIQFSVCHSETWRNEDGTKAEKSTWVTVFTKQENLAPYLKKGNKVAVIGNTSLNCYKSQKDGNWNAGLTINANTIELLGESNKDKIDESVIAGILMGLGSSQSDVEYMINAMREEAKKPAHKANQSVPTPEEHSAF